MRISSHFQAIRSVAYFHRWPSFGNNTTIGAASNNLEEIIRLTEIGIGIGLVPMHIGSDFVKENRMFAIPPLDGVSPIDVHFIWNPEVNVTKAEDIFIKYAPTFLAKVIT